MGTHCARATAGTRRFFPTFSCARRGSRPQSVAANFIDDGERLWLVDWEYAGFNSPLFDLGGLASNSELSPEQAERALSLYFGKPVDDGLRLRATAMTAASLLRETMWSMVSEIHSSLDFDYAGYTAENLKRFEAAYETYLAMEQA
jgi:thiamine kinase-like enzyme